MIARLWSAETTGDRAPRYRQHLAQSVIPALRKLQGYRGTTLLERKTCDCVEIIVATFWQSLESVRGFAGSEPEQAVVSDEAAGLLDRFDRRVRHYDVVLRDEVIES